MRLCIAVDSMTTSQSTGDRSLDYKELSDECNRVGFTKPIIKLGLPSVLTPDLYKTIEYFKYLDFGIFLDLKVYDIHNTLNKFLAACEGLEIDMITVDRRVVHYLPAIPKYDYDFRKSPKIISVGCLTNMVSHSSRKYDEIENRYTAQRKDYAPTWKTYPEHFDGIVTHPYFASDAKKYLQKWKKQNFIDRDFLIVCPGLIFTKEHNEKEINPYTRHHVNVQYPSYIINDIDIAVVGREIFDSDDPLYTTKQIMRIIHLLK